VKFLLKAKKEQEDLSRTCLESRRFCRMAIGSRPRTCCRLAENLPKASRRLRVPAPGSSPGCEHFFASGKKAFVRPL
jgi:hypothetical protein